MSTIAMYCRDCGKALDETEKAEAGRICCMACAPRTQAPPASAPGPGAPVGVPSSAGISPGLAFLLGLIPGVGAIYNAQYAKGLVHVIVFGLLISITASDNVVGDLGPLFGMLIPAWVLYMAFEAYHTAQKRLSGQAVDEFSSLVPMKSQGAFPAAPILLMAVGFLLLMHNLEILRLAQILKFWPVALIALGAYMLYVRIAGAPAPPAGREVEHE
jgi:TM2 domain-containing membrane protein YozV